MWGAFAAAGLGSFATAGLWLVSVAELIWAWVSLANWMVEFARALGAVDYLFVRCQGKIGQFPLPDQALGTGFTGGGRKRAQIGWVVDIESNAG